MKKYIIPTLISSLGFIAFAGFMFAHIQIAHANPDQTLGNQTATATTTLSFMTPGTATTTLYFDSQSDGGLPTKSAILMTQFTASSSVSTLQINQEYADDTPGVNCKDTPLACDWYQGSQGMINTGVATSTNNPKIFDVAIVPQYSWLFASSTIGGSGLAAVNNFDARVIPISTPTRYTRLWFSMKIVANGNGAVWAKVVGKKETR